MYVRDVERIRRAMKSTASRRFYVTSARPTRENSSGGPAERRERIEWLNKNKPRLSISRVERIQTNSDFTTVVFDQDIHFPHSVFIDVCV